MFSFRDARRQSSRFNQKSRFQDALHRCSLRVISGRKGRKEKRKKKGRGKGDNRRRHTTTRRAEEFFHATRVLTFSFAFVFLFSRLEGEVFFFFVSAAFWLMTAKGFYSTRSNTMRGKRMKTGDVFSGGKQKWDTCPKKRICFSLFLSPCHFLFLFLPVLNQ